MARLEPGSDLQTAWFRCLAATAVQPADRERLQALLDDREPVPGIDLDPDLRWLVLGHLSGYGLADAERINAEIDGDPSDIGRRRGAACLAARPTAQAKEEAWKRILDARSPIPTDWAKAVDHEPSLAAMASLMAGFVVGSSLVGGFQARIDDLSVLAPYVQRYVDALPEFWDRRSIDEAETFTECLYPRYLVSDEVIAIIDRVLEEATLPSPALRILREGRDGTVRAQRAQEFDRASAATTTPIG